MKNESGISKKGLGKLFKFLNLFGTKTGINCNSISQLHKNKVSKLFKIFGLKSIAGKNGVYLNTRDVILYLICLNGLQKIKYLKFSFDACTVFDSNKKQVVCGAVELLNIEKPISEIKTINYYNKFNQN